MPSLTNLQPIIVNIFVPPSGPEAVPAPPPVTNNTGIAVTTPASAVTTSSGTGGQGPGGQPENSKISPTILPGNVVRVGGRCLSATERTTYTVPADSSIDGRLADVSTAVKTATNPLLRDLVANNIPEIILAPISPTSVTVTMKEPVNTTEPITNIKYFAFFERNVTKTPDGSGGRVGGARSGTTTSSPGSGDVVELKSFQLHPPLPTTCSGLAPDVNYEVKIYVVKKTRPSDIWIRIQLPDAILPGGLYPTTTPTVSTDAFGQPITTAMAPTTTAMTSTTSNPNEQCGGRSGNRYTGGGSSNTIGGSRAMGQSCGYIPSGPIRIATPKSGAPINVPTPGTSRPDVNNPKVRVSCRIPSKPVRPEDIARLPGGRPLEPTGSLTTAPPVSTTSPPAVEEIPTYVVYRDGSPISSGEGAGMVEIEDCCDQFSIQPIYSVLVCYGDKCTSSPSQTAPARTSVPISELLLLFCCTVLPRLSEHLRAERFYRLF